jgi:exopolyphosphatase/guanosine-5'-triphosphate,3'-diphosphate pyrophosphatase
MPVLAAIDVGSNAIRLLIGNVDADRRTDILESVRDPVRLGQDVFTGGIITEGTIERAAEALLRFKRLITSQNATLTRAVATSAVREAANRDQFVKQVEQATGIHISVISAEEEARLIHLAVATKINLKDRLAILADVGGGSTEITLVSDGTIISTESYKMGAVRLLQVLEERKHGERQFNQMVREYVDATQNRIRREIGHEKVDLLVGTGGNIESLGELRKELFKKDRNSVIASDELETLVKKLQSMSFEERIRQLHLRPDRADVIVPASIVLQKIVKLAGVDEVLIPGVGLKDGLLKDMILELYEKKQLSRDQVITSALQLGRKYRFDEQHGLTVAKLAVKLFDETKSLHTLSLESRLVLEVAALLHDIGQFVNTDDHHKHTQYLLRATPLIGLDESQMAIVSNVARYHRKSLPKLQHELYRALTPRERVIVTKLAALLRLADAMDNEHASKVHDFEVEYRKPKVVMKLKGEGDMFLERWALMKKSSMIEEVFGVEFSVEE